MPLLSCVHVQHSNYNFNGFVKHIASWFTTRGWTLALCMKTNMKTSPLMPSNMIHVMNYNHYWQSQHCTREFEDFSLISGDSCQRKYSYTTFDCVPSSSEGITLSACKQQSTHASSVQAIFLHISCNRTLEFSQGNLTVEELAIWKLLCPTRTA